MKSQLVVPNEQAEEHTDVLLLEGVLSVEASSRAGGAAPNAKRAPYHGATHCLRIGGLRDRWCFVASGRNLLDVDVGEGVGTRGWFYACKKSHVT